MAQEFTELSGPLARASGVSQACIGRLANEGLLECIRLSNGTRLLRAGQAERVRKLVAERMVKARRPVANT